MGIKYSAQGRQWQIWKSPHAVGTIYRQTAGLCACLLTLRWYCIHDLHRGPRCDGKLRPGGCAPSSDASFHADRLQIQTHWPETERWIKSLHQRSTNIGIQALAKKTQKPSLHLSFQVRSLSFRLDIFSLPRHICGGQTSRSGSRWMGNARVPQARTRRRTWWILGWWPPPATNQSRTRKTCDSSYWCFTPAGELQDEPCNCLNPFFKKTAIFHLFP